MVVIHHVLDHLELIDGDALLQLKACVDAAKALGEGRSTAEARVLLDAKYRGAQLGCAKSGARSRRAGPDNDDVERFGPHGIMRRGLFAALFGRLFQLGLWRRASREATQHRPCS